MGISVDSPEQNAAMVAKLQLPFPVLSDPDRSRAIEPYEVAHPSDPREIAIPAIVLIGPDGVEAFRRVGRDYADRPPEDEVVDRVRAMGLPATEQGAPAVGPATAGPKALTVEQLLPYFRGARFAVNALKLRRPEIAEDADRYIEQVDRYYEALRDRLRG